MTPLLPYLAALIALLSAAAQWGATSEQLKALRGILDDHRRDAAARDASAQTKLDTLLERHTDLASRVAVLERDLSHQGTRDSEADTTLRRDMTALAQRVTEIERARHSR